MISFGSMLQMHRTSLNFRQEDVVSQFNKLDKKNTLSASRYGRIERDEVEATVSELVGFAEVLQTTVECLSLGECINESTEQCELLQRLQKHCENMSEQRRQVFLQFVLHNAELATQIRPDNDLNKL